MSVTSYFMAWNFAAVLCLLVGLALMIYEMFTPGMGVAALLGSLALIASIVLSASSLSHALITLALIMLVLGVAAFFVFRAFARGKIGRIVLKESMDGESTPLSEMQDLVGQEGISLSMLRPSGVADFNGQRLDVVSEGGFIPKATPVRITRIEGLRIIVRPVEA